MIYALTLAAALAGAPASPQPDTAEPADYSQDANWLCRPGREDACTQDMTATAVAPDGTLTLLPFTPPKSPKIDCFYVYPTVSFDPDPNSDLVAGPEEAAAAASQFARFRSVCRTFAPVYRQVTLAALRGTFQGSTEKPDRELAYRDVLAAWRHYLASDNGGSGVILIGHSQGSGVLKRLIAEEIEGKPTSRRLVGAYLIGMNVLVPEGKTVGGDFKSTPLCERARQTGCVVSYVSFRDTSPPPASAPFGRTDRPRMKVACTNPAALGSAGRVPLDSRFSNRQSRIAADRPAIAWAKDSPVSTPFVSVPGLVDAQCVDRDGAQFLSVGLNADPADARTDEIGGEVLFAGKVVPSWGLHLIDIYLTSGDLIRLAEQQVAAYRSR